MAIEVWLIDCSFVHDSIILQPKDYITAEWFIRAQNQLSEIFVAHMISPQDPEGLKRAEDSYDRLLNRLVTLGVFKDHNHGREALWRITRPKMDLIDAIFLKGEF